MIKQSVLITILQAIALGAATATVVLGILNSVPPQTLFTLLGIGLFALALAAFQKSS